MSSAEESKCDFLLLNEDKGKAYFIELKGSDLLHAVEQLEATYLNSKLESIRKNYICCFRAVLRRSNTHKINSSKVLAFRKKYQDFKTGTSKMDEII